MKNSIFYGRNMMSYFQDNFLAHSLCNVTYLMSNLQMYDSLLHKQDSAKIVKYPRTSNIFIYISSTIDTKIGYLKLGVGLFNSSYKQYV